MSVLHLFLQFTKNIFSKWVGDQKSNKFSYCRDSTCRLGHSPSRDKGRTDGIAMEMVASLRRSVILKRCSKVFILTKMLVHGDDLILRSLLIMWQRGRHTIERAIVENPLLDANITMLCAIKPKLLTTEVLNAVQGSSSSPILVPIYDYPLVNSTNIHRNLHCLQDIGDYWSNALLLIALVSLFNTFVWGDP